MSAMGGKLLLGASRRGSKPVRRLRREKQHQRYKLQGPDYHRQHRIDFRKSLLGDAKEAPRNNNGHPDQEHHKKCPAGPVLSAPRNQQSQCNSYESTENRLDCSSNGKSVNQAYKDRQKLHCLKPSYVYRAVFHRWSVCHDSKCPQWVGERTLASPLGSPLSDVVSWRIPDARSCPSAVRYM